VDTFDDAKDRDFISAMLDNIEVKDISGKGRMNLLNLNSPNRRVQETTFSDDGRLIAADYSRTRLNDGRQLGSLRWDELTFSQYKNYMDELGLDTKKIGTRCTGWRQK
jgi:hypothetical protein